MEKINRKITLYYEALQTLDDAIALFREYEELARRNATEKNEKIALGMRDSMIQRFEYCTDLFWKILKVYLEEVEKVSLGVLSPRGVLRAAVTARIITEAEGEQCMAMVKSRNETSHIYHAQVAQDIAQDIPAFYQLIKSITDRIKERLDAK